MLLQTASSPNYKLDQIGGETDPILTEKEGSLDSSNQRSFQTMNPPSRTSSKASLRKQFMYGLIKPPAKRPTN